MVQVGNRSITHKAAVGLGREYLTPGSGWAYPAYDGYRLDSAAGPLADADLLAPALLNVTQTRLTTYYALVKVMPQLQEALDALPADLSLANADDGHLQLIGMLYRVRDQGLVPGSRGTRLSKILHRKRPSLIPLYDEQVRRRYQDGSDPPVKPERGRTWVDFMAAFARAVRTDLIAGATTWGAISQLAPPQGPPVTALRALDIVAWRLGKDASGR